MKDIPTSPRILEIKRKRRVRRLRLSVLFFVLLIAIISFLAYFSFHPKVNINLIVINGNNVINKNDLEESIKGQISGKYLGIFSKSNSFIYPQKRIYKNLISEFSRIENLSMKREGLNTLVFEIKERAGAYLYCGAVLPENLNDIGDNCYFVNDDGLIFDKAPYFSGDIYMKFYTEIENLNDNFIGSSVFEKDYFHKIANFIDGVNSLGLKTSYLARNKDEYYLYLQSDKIEKPKIIFIKENDLDIIFENLSLAIGKLEFANEIKNKYDKLLYIDLRFDNKVLYKFD